MLRVSGLLLCRCVALSALLALAGCGGGVRPGTLPAQGAAVAITGNVHGGQQPVSAAKVYLYAVSSTADGGAATSLLTSLVPGQAGFVPTDVNGNFSITGDYTCPAGSDVYLLSVGGNPGLTGVVSNPQLVLSAGLGACSSLTASSFFTINEVTTVTMAYAFAGFESSSTQIGSATATNVTNAFTNITNYIDPVHGFAKSALPASDTIRQTIDSLADSIAACVNSSGTGTACSMLFTATTLSTGAPTDTFGAAINVAQNPTMNVATIYNLGASNGPFQPTLSQAPATWAFYSLPSFFSGQQALTNGVYYLAFPTGYYFGYYSFLTDPHYIYHFDLGYEYVTDANDGKSGVYFYDFKSGHTFYTSPTYPFPYLYDYTLQTELYYYPDPNNPGHYNTNGTRYFYDFATSTIISF